MASYKISYWIQNQLYKEDLLEDGTPLEKVTAPDLEGYDVISWEPQVDFMPSSDLELHAVLERDSFVLTQMVDEEVWSTQEFSSGADLSDLPLPEKTGYTFSGWVKKYKKMPKSNLTLRGSFKINTYKITFDIDGILFEKQVEYGTPLDFVMEPERPHYSFSGFGGVPKTMPANDLYFKGTFAIQQHVLHYVLGGEAYKDVLLAYGAPIVPLAVPQKEGYVFSGWRNIPKTMGDEDLTIEGKYNQKKYKIYFMVQGDKYTWMSLTPGSAITPPEDPVVSGFRFIEWSDFPEMMPEHDVTVQAKLASCEE